ncbi:MAG: hypothetical protein Q7T89_04370 [Anaerolineales bacterium]|nr:hypothetical protein [Anaerolineales bacterium]
MNGTVIARRAIALPDEAISVPCGGLLRAKNALATLAPHASAGVTSYKANK